MSVDTDQIPGSAPGLRDWGRRRELPNGHPQSPLVYLRPLEFDDANQSWQWRNNPEIWRLTAGRPDRPVTPESEKRWLAEVLSRKNEARFAICLKADGRYIGNVFYTKVARGEAEPHIFIGEPSYWGKGIASDASLLLHEYGFGPMGLVRIKANVHSSNVALLRMCASHGHVKVSEEYDDNFKAVVIRLVLTKRTFLAYTRPNQ